MDLREVGCAESLEDVDDLLAVDAGACADGLELSVEEMADGDVDAVVVDGELRMENGDGVAGELHE